MKTIEVVVVMRCADHVTPREVVVTVANTLCDALEHPYMDVSFVTPSDSTDTDGVPQ